MASGEEKGDNLIPIALQKPPPEQQISVERFWQIVAERDEALKLNEKISAELAEANRHNKEISNQFDEMLKERDGLRSEIGNTVGLIEEKISEIKNLSETVAQLHKLSKGMVISDPFSKENQLFHAEEDEIFPLAGALVNIVKTSQSEILELQHSLEELRAESAVLKENLESQSKELKLKSLQIQELEEEKGVANESVKGLMIDIAVAKEEIMRWKVIAEQEATAGKAVEQEFLAQIAAVKQELEEARQVMLDLDKKFKFKEETANAAMAATRDAAEKSLRLADVRASRLKERLFDLTCQLEQLDSRKDSSKGGLNGHRYVCWPWQWLGLDFVGSCHSETEQESSNKKELSEPLL